MTTREQAVVGTGLGLYSRAAQRSSARVIREYSTSFGKASRLLDHGCRPDVESIYGLVRIADEIVDGAAKEAGLDSEELHAVLDGLEAETDRAVALGYSANVVVHAFAITARRVGIGRELTAPFFASMRRDLSPVAFTAGELERYIYGSAEVVGLMCLRVFLRGRPVGDVERNELELGARKLGAAFQKVNFLRDLGADWRDLGRNYFADTDPEQLTEQRKLELVADVEADLAVAARAIARLPRGCRPAVAAAHELFARLAAEIRRTPAEQLLQRRIRVSTPRKLLIIARARVGVLPRVVS